MALNPTKQKGHPSNPPNGDAAPSDYSRQQFLRCFLPLHALSGVFALWPFFGQRCAKDAKHRSSLCTNRWDILYALVVVASYSTFHLYINYTDAYGVAEVEGTGKEAVTPIPTQQPVEVNFVSIVIDIYNRYSGLVLFWLLHAVALATQHSLVAIVSGVLSVDEQIAQRLSLVPSHMQWCRFICLHMACTFLAIGFAEWYNCIMYMSDFIPVSKYCIFQCYITMLTSSTVEVQYMAFVQLIKNRLQLINDLLLELGEYGNGEEQTLYERFRFGKTTTPSAGISVEFLDEITSSYPRAHQSPVDSRINRNPSTRRSPTLAKPTNDGSPSDPSIPRGDRRWHKLKRRQHKIITVNQAPPPKPTNGRNGPNGGRSAVVSGQFPLLVASLMNSQSKACEHIRMKIINDIKNLYTHLHLLSLNINKAYGAQLIFILMTLFVTLTTLLYYCTMKLFRMLWWGQWASPGDLLTPFWTVLSTLSWTFISTFRILRICNVCNSAKNEAQKIGSLIHGLGWKTECTGTKSMVRVLSLQLQQQRIEFTAGGLFTIDHGLMFNIVGSLATYLLILIQFDIAQNGAKWKSEPPPGNGSAVPGFS